MEGGGVTMKVTEKYVTNKMNFKKDNTKKLWNEGKIERNLLKYIPKKEQKKQKIFENYINMFLINKFD